MHFKEIPLMMTLWKIDKRETDWKQEDKKENCWNNAS